MKNGNSNLEMDSKINYTDLERVQLQQQAVFAQALRIIEGAPHDKLDDRLAGGGMGRSSKARRLVP